MSARVRLALSAALSLLAAPALAGPPKAKAFELKGDAAKGEATYQSLCWTCHGKTGEGDGPGGAALNPKPAKLSDAKRAGEVTDEYIYGMIKEGGAANGRSAAMVAWKTSLNDQQIRDVAAYVRTLSQKAAKPAPAAAKAGKK